MRHILLLLITSLTLAGCGSTPRCATIDPPGLVEALRPKEHLRSMLGMITDRTQTAAIATARNGPVARVTLSRALDAAVERHHKQWTQNLIASWSSLNAVELEQVCTAIRSRDQATYLRFAKRIGADAQKRNGPLVDKAGAEALAAIL